ENKRVANAVVLGLLPDAEAQKAHGLLQEPVRPVLLSERYIRRTGDGNELSAGLQHLEGLFERVLAQTVQDDVIAAQDLLEIFFLVVDDDIRAETFDQIDIRGARRSRHRCAGVLCQLNGECAYSTGTRMDQDFVALLQVGAFNQYLPSCQTHQRDGRCLFHGEILGLQRYVSFIHGDEFRERPDPVLMWPRIDRGARLHVAVQARILQPSVPFAPVVDIGNRAVECCGRHVSRHYVLGFPHITTLRATSGERAWTSAPALLPNGSRLSCGRNGRWCKAGGRQKKSWAALGSFTGHKPVLCTG